MQAVHELGHVLGAWATGATVEGVYLHLLTISHTEIGVNPSPLFVVWAGPLVGIALPLAVAGVARLTTVPLRRYADFLAGFCLVANGAYIGLAAIEGVADSGEMIRNGSPRWLLYAFGATAFAAGLWIWHRVSGDFGFGRAPRQPAPAEALGAAAVAAVLVILAATWGRR